MYSTVIMILEFFTSQLSAILTALVISLLKNVSFGCKTDLLNCTNDPILLCLDSGEISIASRVS